jgi:hypothetical protein
MAGFRDGPDQATRDQLREATTWTEWRSLMTENLKPEKLSAAELIPPEIMTLMEKETDGNISADEAKTLDRWWDSCSQQTQMILDAEEQAYQELEEAGDG